MTLSSHTAEPERAATSQTTPVDEIVNAMEGHVVEGLAALAGAPAGVAELAFNAFPAGTRAWVLTYGLATEEGDGSLAITDVGRQAIELAAKRCPQPYRDVSLEDVMASTQQAIGELVAQSGVRIREPGTHPAPEQTAANRIRRSGLQAAERVQSSLMDRLALARRRERADAAAQRANAEHSKHAAEASHDQPTHVAP